MQSLDLLDLAVGVLLYCWL